jgi:hypothetical protein
MSTQPLNEFNVEVPRIPPQPESIVVSPPPQRLAMQREPQEVLQEAAKAAAALRDVIESKPHKVVINGKTYPTHEDWLTVARFFGVTVATRETKYIERGRVRGYEAYAEAILASTGQVVGAGEMECLDDEAKWSDKPLFQLRSMAQTRAQAKALRSIFSWVVVLAGYAPTPAEEMDGAHADRAIAPRLEYKPMHPDKVRKLCFQIANAPNDAELKKVYFPAYREARDANDRAALDAFVAAKDQRRKELR